MIYTENWQPIAAPDLENGYLETAVRQTGVEPATEKLVLIPGTPYRQLVHTPEKPIYEECQVYHPYTTEQKIELLKAKLTATDYKALKYMEGWLTEDEFAPIKVERQAIRDKINALEVMANA